MPQRPFEDEGVLRTDGSVDQTAAYRSAEAQFSTNDLPTTYAPQASGTRATLTTAMTGTNNDMVFTAKAAGVDGNNISVTFVDPGGVTATLGVPPLTGGSTAIVVNLGRAASAINTTGNALIAAVLAEPTTAALVDVANAGGNDGTGLVTALSQTFLSGATNTAPTKTRRSHGAHALETSEKEDPSKSVHDAYPTDV